MSELPTHRGLRPTTDTPALAPTGAALPLDENPAAVYLASLSEGGRRTMHRALETIAGLLSGGQATALTLPWAQIRYQHVKAIRSALGQTYAPATVNKMLSALRGVLKEAFNLGQMDAQAYQRARGVEGVVAYPVDHPS